MEFQVLLVEGDVNVLVGLGEAFVVEDFVAVGVGGDADGAAELLDDVLLGPIEVGAVVVLLQGVGEVLR